MICDIGIELSIFDAIKFLANKAEYRRRGVTKLATSVAGLIAE